MTQHPRIKYKIREKRKEIHLTQGQLASRIGVQQHTISAFERGIYEPKSTTLARMCVVFECEPGDLMELSRPAA